MKRHFSGLRIWLRDAARRRRFVVAYCLSLLIAYSISLFASSPAGFLLSGPGDFTSFYTAGTIMCRVQGDSLYNLNWQAEIQREILTPYGLSLREGVLPYANPPIYAVLFTPFCKLPLHWAATMWNAINLAVLLFCIALLWRSMNVKLRGGFNFALLLSLSLVFVYFVFRESQITFWLLLAFVVVFLALKNQREEIAGVALALVWLKPQLLFVFVIVFALRRRWRVLSAFLLTTGLLFVASLLLLGWNGLKAYAELVGRGASWDGMPGMYPMVMPNVRGSVYRLAEWLDLAAPSALLQSITMLVTLILIWWVLRQWRGSWRPDRPEFLLQLAITLSAALLISPHIYLHDFSLLILVGFSIWRYAIDQERTFWASRRIGVAHVGALGVVLLVRPVLAVQVIAVLLLILVWELAHELRSARSGNLLQA